MYSASIIVNASRLQVVDAVVGYDFDDEDIITESPEVTELVCHDPGFNYWAFNLAEHLREVFGEDAVSHGELY